MHVLDIGFKEWKTFDEETKMFEEFKKNTYKCKCGHGVLITSTEDKKLCNWCGNYVFKDKKAEFKYRMENLRCQK